MCDLVKRLGSVRLRAPNYIFLFFLLAAAFLLPRFTVFVLFLLPAWAAISNPVFAAREVKRASLAARAEPALSGVEGPAPPFTESVGNFCFRLRAGSNRSPIFSTRLIT